VRFPFLDYSTLAKRREACDAEIAVNAPYAPEIYRGVVAITREASGKLAIGGGGTAVEWAVDMRRFDEERTLDHITGEIDEALADALGRAVAAAHAKTMQAKTLHAETLHAKTLQAETPPADAERWIAAVGTYIDEHVEAFGQHPEIFPAAANDELARASRTTYQRILPLLRERGRQGFVRRIHGDLHLGNIVLIDGRPVLFDAVEFSDIIASGDVLYDLAFLLMDLLLNDHGDLANAVFNAYLDHAPETAGLRVLPLFLALRAATRSYALAGAAARRADPEEATRLLALAHRHIDAGTEFLAPPAPALIVLGGADQRARSELAVAVAGAVAPAPGARILHCDLSADADWQSVHDILSAGCSVLVEGSSADGLTGAVDAATDLGLKPAGFWIGPGAGHLEPQLWQVLYATSHERARQAIEARLARVGTVRA
jgi:aminoglycoside phosphotransferase family enzyme